MTYTPGSEHRTPAGRRWRRLAAGAALLAALGGCVVYPVGYGYGPPHPYWHGRDWR